MIEFNIYDGDCKVTTDLTNEKKDQIIGLIIEWCKKYDCISDEKDCGNQFLRKLRCNTIYHPIGDVVEWNNFNES